MDEFWERIGRVWPEIGIFHIDNDESLIAYISDETLLLCRNGSQCNQYPFRLLKSSTVCPILGLWFAHVERYSTAWTYLSLLKASNRLGGMMRQGAVRDGSVDSPLLVQTSRHFQSEN